MNEDGLCADDLHAITVIAFDLEQRFAKNVNEIVRKHCLPRAILGNFYCNVSEEELYAFGSYESITKAFADLGFRVSLRDSNDMVTISWYKLKREQGFDV